LPWFISDQVHGIVGLQDFEHLYIAKVCPCFELNASRWEIPEFQADFSKILIFLRFVVMLSGQTP
jgi:hypothetical protein